MRRIDRATRHDWEWGSARPVRAPSSAGHHRRNIERDRHHPQAPRRGRPAGRLRGERLLQRRRGHDGPEQPRRARGSESGAPAPSGEAVSGSIIVAGSSTVEPISTGVAEAFKAANPDFNYTITGEGTGDGFQRFCAGETDISDASRQIKAEGEADVCATNGVEYLELKVAVDGISVLTALANTGVTCLSFADIYSLVGPESTGFAKWSDGQAIATALGSSTVLPDADLSIFGPGEESGTFDSFVELVLTDSAEARTIAEDQITTRPDYTASANDNAIIEGIAGSPTSLGWVGFAFFEENLDKVHAIGVTKEAERHVRRADRRDHRRRQLPDRPRPVHLRQQGQGPGEPGRRRLRRLLPGRRHHLVGPRDRPVREPRPGGPGRDPGRLDEPLAPTPPTDRPGLGDPAGPLVHAPARLGRRPQLRQAHR